MSIDFSINERGVGHILINRPERMNALDSSAKTDFGHIWNEVETDPKCRVVVVSGAGDKAFCAGSDIKEMQVTGGMVDTGTLMNAIPGIGCDLSKPIVAALHGFTVGMGMTMAIHCDFRIATSTAKFCFPETKHGMLSGVSAVTLPGLIGEAAALDIMLSARILDADEALRMGLIHRISEGDGRADVLDSAMCFAEGLASNSGLAMGLTKNLLLLDRRRRAKDYFREINAARSAVMSSSEFSDVVQRKEGAGRM